MPTCRDIAAESDRRYLSDKIRNDHVNFSSLYCNEHRGQAKQDINQTAQWAQNNVNTRDVAGFTVILLMERRKQDGKVNTLRRATSSYGIVLLKVPNLATSSANNFNGDARPRS